MDMRPWSDIGSDTSGLPVLWSHEADFPDVVALQSVTQGAA